MKPNSWKPTNATGGDASTASTAIWRRNRSASRRSTRCGPSAWSRWGWCTCGRKRTEAGCCGSRSPCLFHARVSFSRRWLASASGPLRANALHEHMHGRGGIPSRVVLFLTIVKRPLAALHRGIVVGMDYLRVFEQLAAVRLVPRAQLRQQALALVPLDVRCIVLIVEHRPKLESRDWKPPRGCHSAVRVAALPRTADVRLCRTLPRRRPSCRDRGSS